MNTTDRTTRNASTDTTPGMAEPLSSAVVSAAPPLPQWRVCSRCGHMWRSRSRGLRFRCHRCEEAARNAARNVSRAAGGDGR
jgi:NADH pyrophosphatase NudC (nudix superfamily)